MIKMYEEPDDIKVYDLLIPAEVEKIKEELSDGEEDDGSELSENNHAIKIMNEKVKNFLPRKESENSLSYSKRLLFPIKKMEQNLPNQIICYVCGKTLSSKQANFRRHLKGKHGIIESVKYTVKCEEPACDYMCSKVGELRTHLQSVHKLDQEVEELHFTNFEDFNTWKHSEEIRTKSRWVVHSRNTPNSTHYFCNRSGNKRTIGTEERKRMLKAQGSCKMNATCTSYMSVKDTNGSLQVMFYKSHYGHDVKLEHIRLDQHHKNLIATQLKQEFEDDGWTERLIQAIQSKPDIYNTNLPGHSYRYLVSRRWNEVYEIMFPTWQNMSSSEKSAKGKDLQGKWRNLRTCFQRELNKQRLDTLSQSTAKRRKYVYFDQLLFLLPTIQDHRPTVGDCSPSHTQEDNSNTEVDVTFDNTSQIVTSIEQPPSTPKTKETQRYDESVLSILKSTKAETFDDDKAFLLSLVSSFKNLTNAQKLEAKIEFLTTLKRLSQPCNESLYRRPTCCESQRDPSHYCNIPNEGNHLSRSSTPIPLESDVSQASRGSSFEQLYLHQDFPDF